LFANTVTHGYARESADPVWLTLEAGETACRVVYEDAAEAYDPFAAPDHARLDAGVEERPVGGLGVLLLTQMSSSHSYARRDGKNVIEFEVPLSKSDEAHT